MTEGHVPRCGLAGERGRDWMSVAIGLVIVVIATAALWSWLDGAFPAGTFGGGIGAGWLVAISAAVILLLVLLTRMSRSRRRPPEVIPPARED